VVEYVNPATLVAQASQKVFDFKTLRPEELERIEIPFSFTVTVPCVVHGIAGWFDLGFDGEKRVVLSTSPYCAGTHWYQIELMLRTPIAANAGQFLDGTLTMDANKAQSYNMKVKIHLRGSEVSCESEVLDLKDPEYRFFSNPAATYTPPEGGHVAQAPLITTPNPRETLAAFGDGANGDARANGYGPVKTPAHAESVAPY
jgi:histone-arginine methyltransferase CARM1